MAGDADALARAAAGDAAAFDGIVRRHEARVRSFLARIAGADVDDLAQQTFVAAWRQAGRYRGDGEAAAWLLSIAWSQFLMATRARRRADRRDADWSDAVPQSAGPAQEAVVDHARVLAALDERERAVLVLTLGHGYSQADAAAILAMPLGTLKSVQARARAKAAAMLTEDVP